MSLTIKDAQEATHEGYMRAQMFLGDFMRAWLAPQIEMVELIQAQTIVAQWDGLEPEIVDGLKEENPAGYTLAAAKIAELRKQIERKTRGG